MMSRGSLSRTVEGILVRPLWVGIQLFRCTHLPGLGRHLRNAWWRARLRSLGEESGIGPHVVIHTPENVSVGARCSIAEFVHMWGGGGITIGDDVMIASHAVITSLTHDSHAAVYRTSLVRAPVIIADNVWIGAGAVILPGVRIGTGSIVGAGSVVTRDVPAGCIVVGIPARTMRAVAYAGMRETTG